MASSCAPRCCGLGVACRLLGLVTRCCAATPVATVLAMRTETSKSLELRLMKLARLCMLVLLGVFAWAAPGLAQAAVTTRAFATAFAQGDSPDESPPFQQTFFDEDIFGDAAIAAAAAVHIGPRSGTGVANASARGAVHDISVSARAAAFGPGSGNAHAEVRAAWTDQIKLSTPGLSPGAPIKLDILLSPQGFFTANATLIKFPPMPPRPTPPDAHGVAYGILDIFASSVAGLVDPMGSCLNSGLCAFRDLAPINNIDTDISPPSAIVASMTTPNGLGNIITIGATLYVEARASRTAEAVITGYFSGSIHWGGIENVRNALTDEPILDWTITSDSGFDYSKPFVPEVPEPSSIALLSVGLCAWLGRARRRGWRA
jgi:hypothetical protein